MRYRIEVEPDPQIVDLKSGRVTPLRTHATLLAVLALSEAGIAREDLLAAVWPDTELAVARNRLRVALTKFKQSHPGLIVAEAQSLALAPDVECDLRDALAAIHDLDSAMDSRQDHDALAGIFTRLAPAADVVARMPSLAAVLAELARRYITASGAESPASLPYAHLNPHFPVLGRNEHFLVDFLNAAILAGEGASAWTSIRPHVPAALQKEPSIRELVRAAIQGQAEDATQFRPEEQTVLLALAQVLAASRPDLLRSVVGAPEALPLSAKHPRAMHDLLARATAADPVERDATWLRCMARLAGLKAWLGDAAGVLRVAVPVLEHTDDPYILRALWNTIAIAHSLNRNWDQANDALAQTIAYAQQAGRDLDVVTAKGNGAFFRTHLGQYEAAYADYEANHATLLAMGTPMAMYERSVGLGHQAFIPFFQGQWQAAQEHFERAITARSAAGSEVQLGLLQLCLACARLMQRNPEEVESLTRAGLRDAYAADSMRTIQISLEFVAGTLFAAGDAALAAAIVHWVGRWRKRTQCPRSFAEESWCDRFRGPHDPLGDELTPAEVGRMALARLRQLLRA